MFIIIRTKCYKDFDDCKSDICIKNVKKNVLLTFELRCFEELDREIHGKLI